MEPKPIKRSKHLTTISREHHFGLLFCWKIRQGINLRVDTARITRYVQIFWNDNLHPHFREEETLLFLDRSDTLVQKAYEEHAAIRTQIKKIIHASERVTPQELNVLTDSLDNHIRFEEQVLFPHLEKTFTEGQLKLIDNSLEDASAVQLKNNYSDEFWRDPKSSL